MGVKSITVLVKFNKSSFSKTYAYKTNIRDLKIGDLLLVQAQDGYSIATFEEYTTTDEKLATKWVVQRLDVTEFENKLFLGEM